MKPTNPTILALAACLMLTACFGGIRQIRSPETEPQGNLMVRCPKTLPLLKAGENAVDNHIETARMYHACANKVDGWIDWYDSTKETAE